jgi:hypothetical protein
LYIRTKPAGQRIKTHEAAIEQTFNVLEAWITRHGALTAAFGDFGAFLTHAVPEAIGDVTGHYPESGYSWQAKSVN